MTLAHAEQLVKALLYEGYALYPYRASAVKNQQRWTFGCLLPHSYCTANPGSDDWQMQIQCLVPGGVEACAQVRVRFLHVVDRVIGEPTAERTPPSEESYLEPGYRRVESLEIDGRQYHTWQESVEREVILDCPLSTSHNSQTIDFPSTRDCEFLRDSSGEIAGVCVRVQKPIRGSVEVCAEPLGRELFKLSVRISNPAERQGDELHTRSDAILRSLVSTHVILGVQGGEFVSLIDPPEEFREIALRCENKGAWPVLVGTEGSRNMMLASPIILYDYPQIAPESPGNLFDGTEIDELLSLRIRTLTDDEKRQAASVDDRVHELLQRTDSLTDDRIMNLHGRARLLPIRSRFCSAGSSFSRSSGRPTTLQIGDHQLSPGDRVRLHPRGRADAMDVILDGRSATIQSFEQDFEDNFYVTVTIDDDPGRDLGESGQPGHRFFFRRDEIEPITTTE